MIATYFQKTIGMWAVVVALTAMAWAPTAGAEPPAPPAPPPPAEQQADEDEQPRQHDQTRQDEQTRQDSRQRASTSPVVRDGKQPISKTRYVLGGLVGSYYGLGIGHAIVGEWSTTGWFYTVGEAMSATVMFIGLVRSLDDLPHSADDGRTGRTSRADQRVNEAMMISGVVAFSVLRVSEIYDLWTRPEVAGAPRDDDTAFAVTPTATDGGLGASFSWSW